MPTGPCAPTWNHLSPFKLRQTPKINLSADDNVHCHSFFPPSTRALLNIFASWAPLTLLLFQLCSLVSHVACAHSVHTLDYRTCWLSSGFSSLVCIFGPAAGLLMASFCCRWTLSGAMSCGQKGGIRIITVAWVREEWVREGKCNLGEYRLSSGHT